MGEWLVPFALVVVAVGLSGLGYRLGLRHRVACLVPWSLLEELAAHKLLCCGEDAGRVKLELAAYLRLNGEEVEGLVRHALVDGPRPAARAGTAGELRPSR